MNKKEKLNFNLFASCVDKTHNKEYKDFEIN